MGTKRAKDKILKEWRQSFDELIVTIARSNVPTATLTKLYQLTDRLQIAHENYIQLGVSPQTERH